MSQIVGEFSYPAREYSGWLLPLAVFAVTAILSAFILAYYFLPTPPQFARGRPAPTDATELVMLTVGTTGFHIPSNYIVFPEARRGGALDELSLIALFPGLQGYTLEDAQEFNSNAPDAHVVYIGVRKHVIALSQEDRLARVYLPLVTEREGERTSAGARRYSFRDDSGYRGQELYVREGQNGTVLVRCTRPRNDVPSPNCLGDIFLGDGLSATYRFKQTYVAEWQGIEAGARALIGAFMVKTKD